MQASSAHIAERIKMKSRLVLYVVNSHKKVGADSRLILFFERPADQFLTILDQDSVFFKKDWRRPSWATSHFVFRDLFRLGSLGFDDLQLAMVEQGNDMPGDGEKRHVLTHTTRSLPNDVAELGVDTEKLLRCGLHRSVLVTTN